jgi:hypothetical protein
LQLVHPPSLQLGKVSLAKFKPLKAPKVPKSPKLVGIHIRPISNGTAVTHLFHNAKPKEFTFQSPAKMVTHLKRLEQTAWLRPMAGAQQADRAAKIEDIGATP